MKTDKEVLLMKRERKKGKTQIQAAAASGMCPRTASKYERLGQLPSQLTHPHPWRTRDNPFAQDWPWVQEQLERDQGLDMAGFVPSGVSKELHQNGIYGTIVAVGIAHGMGNLLSRKIKEDDTRECPLLFQQGYEHVFCRVVSCRLTGRWRCSNSSTDKCWVMCNCLIFPLYTRFWYDSLSPQAPMLPLSATYSRLR